MDASPLGSGIMCARVPEQIIALVLVYILAHACALDTDVIGAARAPALPGLLKIAPFFAAGSRERVGYI